MRFKQYSLLKIKQGRGENKGYYYLTYASGKGEVRLDLVAERLEQIAGAPHWVEHLRFVKTFMHKG